MQSSPKWIAVLVACLLAGIAGWWIGRRTAPPTVPPETVRTLEAANQSLQQRTLELERDAAELRAQLQAHGVEPPKPTRSPRKPGDDSAIRLEGIRQLAQVQAKLTAATAANLELQNRIHELESTAEKVTQENKRLLSEETDLKETLAATKRLVAALESETKTKDERIAQLDQAIRRSRDTGSAAQQRLAEWTAASREMEDLNRRRENSLNSLQRRYRDLTDQYRALAVRLETQRDNPAPFATDVSRIQNAIQLAEDELRQLISLNSQAQRLSQKMTQK